MHAQNAISSTSHSAHHHHATTIAMNERRSYQYNNNSNTMDMCCDGMNHSSNNNSRHTLSREVKDYGIQSEIAPREWLQKGIEHAQNARLHDAVFAFDRAIEMLHNQVEEKLVTFALFNRGLAKLQGGQYYEASVDFSLAIRNGYSDAVVFFTRATCYLNMKRYQDALVDFDKVLSLDPTDCDALINRSLVYAELKMYEEAIADCCNLITMKPTDASVYDHRCIILKQMKRYDDALVDARRAMMLQYGNVEYQQKYNSLKKLVDSLDNSGWEDNVDEWGSNILYL